MMTHLIERLNSRLFAAYQFRLRHSFIKKCKRLRNRKPEFFNSVSIAEEREYGARWGKVGVRPASGAWFDFLCGVNKRVNLDYVVEDQFFSHIEPILNNLELAPFVNDKSNLSLFSGEIRVPKNFFTIASGKIFTDIGSVVTPATVLNQDIQYPIVLKKAVETSGGDDVMQIDSKDQLQKALLSLTKPRFREKYLIQEKISLAPDLSRFNPMSVSTIRIMTYRPSSSEETVPIKAMLRIGVSDDFRDNMMLGGLCVNVFEDGRLFPLAFDYDGGHFSSHPLTGIVFANTKLDCFSELSEAACAIARRLPDFRLLSFDMTLSKDSSPVCLEINACGQGITQLQYDGRGLFGELTDDVISICQRRPKQTAFRPLRKIYW